MTYCSIQLVRKIAGLDSEDKSDAELRDLRDDVAVPKINDDLNQEIKDEKLEHISSEKNNNIDGSNKTFYVKGTHRSFREIGDLNDDATIDSNDINVYYIDGDDNRITPNVTSLDDAAIGKFSMEKSNGNAIKNSDVDEGPFVTYAVAPTDVSTPSKSVEQACAHLTGALAYSNINSENFEEFSIGSISVSDSGDGSAQHHMDNYEAVVQRIGQRELIQSDENKNDITQVFT